MDESTAFWIDICASTRAHQIREYLLWRHYPWRKRRHRRAALEYAARLRELQK